MPVEDLGDYDVEPVEGNPFGSMAASPNDYDVQAVDHDPFTPSPPMTSADIKAQGGFGTIGPADLSPSQRVQSGLEDAAERAGQPRGLGTLASTVAGYAPISGQVLSGADALYHAGRGEYGQAAASGMGAVPDVGGPLAHGVGAVFAGPMARTADRAALEAAQNMASKGAAPSRIWNKTGWWQGPEDKWRYEIPDYQAEFDPRGGNILGDVLHHPDLYAAYPELADVAVDRYPLKKGQTGIARFTPPSAGAPKGEIAFGYPTQGSTLQPTLTGALHETQHAIQDIPEQFSPGGTPPRQVDPTSPAWPFIEKQLLKGNPGKMPYTDFVKRTTGGPYQYLTQFHPDKLEKAVNQGRYDYYQALAGETEARNVEERYKMGPLLSRVTPPWSKYSQSLPYSKQVVLPPWRSGEAEGGAVTDLGSDEDFPAQPDAFSAPPDQFDLASRQPEATPSSAGGPPLDPGDRDLLIKTVYGEASDQPPLGQAGIAHAILNRVRAGGYGQGVSGVVMAPAAGVNPRLGYHEFSPWNPKGVAEGQPRINTLERDNPRAYASIGDIVDKAYSGLIPDPTGGATHYYGRMPHGGSPSWAGPLAALNRVKIGGTTFVGREHGPGQTIQTAGGYAGGGPVQLNAELRRRLALLNRPRYQGGGDVQDPEGAAAPDPFMANAQVRAQQEAQAEQYRQANAPPAPTEPQTWYGRWGKTLDDELTAGGTALGQAQDWLGNKLEQGVGTTAAAIGVPSAAGFARDIRAMVESGEGMPMRHGDPAFPEGRIATRVPSSVKVPDPHLNNTARIGIDTLQSQPETYAKTAQVGREMPYVKTVTQTDDGPKTSWTPTNLHNFPDDATDEEIHQGLINHWKSNILALHDAVPEDIRPGSMLWYDGANTRATQKALTYGRPVENTAGVYAALSPQKDWFENVSLGDRVMDIMHNRQDTPFTPAMWKWARSYAAGDKDLMATYRSMAPTKDSPGRTLGQINDPDTQALWLRAYDEAHNPRDYNIVNPDGTFGPTATNDNGKNSKVAWGSMNMISKAISAFNAPDMQTISRAMGDRHKVRNFYNNIAAPNSNHGDVTIDTHAIAGANLIPMAGEDKDVDIGLGGSGGKNATSGSKGLYGAYAEAYRQAAAERGLQPRQMQSITWEALRGLWTPSEKGDPAMKAYVQNVWNMHQLGQIDLPTAQRMLMTDPQTGASRIRPPDWHTAGWRPQG